MPHVVVSVNKMCIRDRLQTDQFSGAVLGQTISQNEDLQKLADRHGITLGKAQLIQQIISQNTRYTFEKMCIRDSWRRIKPLKTKHSIYVLLILRRFNV